MKNRSIVMNILLCICISLILLLLMVVFSLLKIVFPSSSNNVEKRIITNNYDLNEIDTINFDFTKANSIFKTTDDNELKIVQNSKEEKFYINFEKKGHKLYFEEDGYLINSEEKKYTIYIPNSYVGSINIVNGFGKNKMTGIKNNIKINNNSGKIYLKEAGNIEVTDVSGELNIKNTLGNIKISTSTGDVIIDHIEGILNVDTITGNIKVTKFIINDESNFETVSGDISLKISNQSDCVINSSNEKGKTRISSNVCNGGKNNINVKNVTGLINIY